MSHDVAVAQWGNALGIRIPKESCLRLGLSAGDHVDVEVAETEGGTGLLVRKINAPFCLESLFEGYRGEYRPTLLDWGKPVGKEVWL
jgi:antitoxin MazE